MTNSESNETSFCIDLFVKHLFKCLIQIYGKAASLTLLINFICEHNIVFSNIDAVICSRAFELYTQTRKAIPTCYREIKIFTLVLVSSSPSSEGNLIQALPLSPVAAARFHKTRTGPVSFYRPPTKAWKCCNSTLNPSLPIASLLHLLSPTGLTTTAPNLVHIKHHIPHTHVL